jgi:uncharacterized protein YndB with AHSA1/START domain
MTNVDEAKVTCVVQRIVAAPVAAVFRAWTDAEWARRWSWGKNYDTISIELVARVGGTWRQHIRDRTNGKNWFFHSVFQEIVPLKKVVHTFHLKSDQGEDEDPSVVEVVFRDLGDKTEVTITHSQLQADKKVETEEGWADCCQCIERCTT